MILSIIGAVVLTLLVAWFSFALWDNTTDWLAQRHEYSRGEVGDIKWLRQIRKTVIVSALIWAVFLVLWWLTIGTHITIGWN